MSLSQPLPERPLINSLLGAGAGPPTHQPQQRSSCWPSLGDQRSHPPQSTTHAALPTPLEIRGSPIVRPESSFLSRPRRGDTKRTGTEAASSHHALGVERRNLFSGWGSLCPECRLLCPGKCLWNWTWGLEQIHVGHPVPGSAVGPPILFSPPKSWKLPQKPLPSVPGPTTSLS